MVTLLCALLAAPSMLMAAPQAPAAPDKRAATPATVAGEKRMALVVGNARYPTIPLNNPENDARVVAATLRRLGFEVGEHVNLGVRDFRKVLREFARRIQDQPGVAVLFYAGHGVQIDGRNYLLPVDLNLRDEEEVKDESVDIDELFLSRIERAKAQVRIVILDACRDNPFRKTRNIRSVGGLAEMAARGTLIGFSSAPGATAEDGPAGTNSAYTRHLAKEMLVEGLEVEQMFKNVRVNVLKDTNQRQLPWVNTSLTTSFSFNPSRGPGKEELARQEEVRRLQALLDRREIEQKKLEEEVKRLNKQIEGPKATAQEPPPKQATAQPPGPPSSTPKQPTAQPSESPSTAPKQATAQPSGPPSSAPKQATAPSSAPPSGAPKQTTAQPSGRPASTPKQASAQPSAPTSRPPPEAPKQAAAQPRETPESGPVTTTKEASEPKIASRKSAAPGNHTGKKADQAPPAERPITVSKAQSERCVALLIRAQLGEPLAGEEMAYLRKECR